MYTHRPLMDEREQEEAGENRQTASLVGVAITLVLLILGLFLVHRLHWAGALEDCLMAGRSNCDVQAGTPW